MASQSFLVISYSIPNRAAGTPVVIRKLLENFGSDEVVLIGRPTLKREQVKGGRFHYPTLTIPTPPVGFRGEKIWRFLSMFLGIVVGLIAYFRYRPGAILAFYRDESSLFTGYLLHKVTKLPLFTYFCDIYLENYSRGFYRSLAEWLQPKVFRDSQKVIVLTEAMQEYFKEKYTIDSIVIPHCNNLTFNIEKDRIRPTDVCNIGYLGGINVDRVNSLQALCGAISRNSRFFINYFTPTSPEYIRSKGLHIENSSIAFIADDGELIKRLALQDILFLPLSLPPEKRERDAQVLTGFPTKVIEYLLCRVPILVHGDANVFAARFMKERKCGYVVEKDQDLITALHNLNKDEELRSQILAGIDETLSYFDGKKIADSLRGIIFRREA